MVFQYSKIYESMNLVHIQKQVSEFGGGSVHSGKKWELNKKSIGKNILKIYKDTGA